MRYGLSVPPFCDPHDIVDLAVQAEAAGWNGFFLWDHLRFDTGRRVDVHNPWVVLGAIAGATSSMLLGTLVTPLARRRPWQVAKEVTTLDHLSGGRAVLGVGLGDPSQGDFADFGDPATFKERAEVIDEALEVVDALLRGEEVDHRGKHYTVTSQLWPRPVQQPRPPIWVAARAPHARPLARARRWDGFAPIGGGDGLLTPDELRGYLGDVIRPGWEVLAPWAPGFSAEEYADAGATWLIDSTFPGGDWLPELRERVLAGPGADPPA